MLPIEHILWDSGRQLLKAYSSVSLNLMEQTHAIFAILILVCILCKEERVDDDVTEYYMIDKFM